MFTVIAYPLETPRLLSRIATFRYDDISGPVTFFVTWRYVTHMHMIRSAYKLGIQVAFQYYK